MKTTTLILVFMLSLLTYSQEITSLNTYRAEKTKEFDLVNTRLQVAFDFQKREMPGKAWITAKPHFYDSQYFKLDAKAMLIHEVSMQDIALEYTYNNATLVIDLNRPYTQDETFEVYIKYTARPELVSQKGSMAISEAKGLYFIDPDGTDPEKTTQIWTQGETESSSCWFPTIDSPNQKTTQEIYITVPNKYTTLSNGTLFAQIENPDSTRTDHWKMTKPHAPYLFFMGVGEYSVVRDHWKGIDVNYYVEPAYEAVAQTIFGHTPEMMQFFSLKFGVPYPWEKYSQIVGRDYISGAMENTTATLHGEMAYQKAGQLVDENTWEDVISHELSHHWFGDLVTTESWSNITVNESFATYCEYLWREYKYGKDHADAHLYDDKNMYLFGNNYEKNLVRFHYENREDVFDGVSYQKGSNILHMLRKYLGDDAFFSGLKHYLIKHQYKAAEAHQLRIALEEVSGKDLNPFFNQWYYENGHPKLHISYEYNDLINTLNLSIKQADKIFSFPLSIDVYESGQVVRHTVAVDKKAQKFAFKYSNRPDLVNVNADHVLLCEITDEFKMLDNYIYQYNHAPHYMDRRDAIAKLANNQDNKLTFATLTKALNDPYFGLRIMALNSINLGTKHTKKQVIKTIEQLAHKDPKTKVQAAAIAVLGKLINPSYKPLFERGVKSKSYAVKGSATLALYRLDKNLALAAIANFDAEAKDFLAPLLIDIYIAENDESQMPYIATNLLDMLFVKNSSVESQQRFSKAFTWIAKSNNVPAIQNLVTDLVEKGNRYKKYRADQMALGFMRQILALQSKESNSEGIAIETIVKRGMANIID